jgi:DNA-binding SARP family transcriptional activator
MPRLTLLLFDRLQAVLDGVPLNNFRSAKAQALLAYLVLEARRPHAREVLATLFWPDDPDAVSKQNLRQALYQLRQLLGKSAATFLLTTRDTVQFNPESSYSLDVADFLAHLEKQELEAAVKVYQGDLLAEMAIDSEPFEEWLLVTRERLHILALDALGQLAQRALDQSDPAMAQAYARRQLVLESWREEAHRQLMLALAAGGDRNAALAQYETCRRILASELAVEPDEETQKLAVRQARLPARLRLSRRLMGLGGLARRPRSRGVA